MNGTRIAVIAAGIALAAGALACGGAGTDDPPPATPAVTVTTQSPDAAPAATKPVSVEQANANQAAADYLEGQSFSRKELIGQLKFEGYPEKVATAAVDSLHADWNQQAEKAAKSYLDGQTFSRKSLIDQLVFDGFTKQQATYGVNHAGL
jgi:hypothetical protein